MLVRFNLVLIGFTFLATLAFAQKLQYEKINTASAESYFKIAKSLQLGKHPSSLEWNELFKTPAYEMLILGGAIDTTVLKSEMEHVFSSTVGTNAIEHSDSELYHKEYRDNLENLEKYIRILNTSNIVDSVKLLLYPFLPKRLQTDQNFPTLFYINYGSPEATGNGGVVFNDLLHAYKIDSYKVGLLSAHESFHAIVSRSFLQHLKKGSNYNSADFNLFYFLQIINEEGIADLIDKPLLIQRNSPLHEEVKKLTENDESISIAKIKKLDSLLTLAFKTETVIEQYQGFAAFANAYSKNGGHVPGRFMGAVIQESGILKNHIESIEDPISFMISYNNAVRKLKKSYPVFSSDSIDYLKNVKVKYWQE
jgi:hypothetical protein